jgi:hypothetical protein
MALSRREMRRIVVDSATYYWRATGTDEGIRLVVVTSSAFVKGQRGQQLVVYFDYRLVPSKGPQIAVSSALVRKAIEAGRRLPAPFSGDPGLADVILREDQVRSGL